MNKAITIEVDPGNARQLGDWDGEHGQVWADHADYYDRATAGYHSSLLAAADVRPGDRVLDVGCGSGQVAIDLVRAAPGAQAVGADLSTAQLDVARRRGDGLAVEFLQADAQVHDFGVESFDRVVSRTGTMFFADPAAAFANLASATRAGGRLAILVWRGLEENPWLSGMIGALSVGRELTGPPPGVPGPFAQSDPRVVEPLLTAAGWSDVAFEPLDHPIWLGPDADRGTQWQLGQAAWLVADLDDAKRAEATGNLHALLAAHQTPEGVLLDSAAWLITARRGG